MRCSESKSQPKMDGNICFIYECCFKSECFVVSFHVRVTKLNICIEEVQDDYLLLSSLTGYALSQLLVEEQSCLHYSEQSRGTSQTSHSRESGIERVISAMDYEYKPHAHVTCMTWELGMRLLSSRSLLCLQDPRIYGVCKQMLCILGAEKRISPQAESGLSRMAIVLVPDSHTQRVSPFGLGVWFRD